MPEKAKHSNKIPPCPQEHFSSILYYCTRAVPAPVLHPWNHFTGEITNDYQLPQRFCIAWFGADYPTLIDCEVLNSASPPFLHPNPDDFIESQNIQSWKALSSSWSQALKLLLFSFYYTTVPKPHSVLIRTTSGVELDPCGSLTTLILRFYYPCFLLSPKLSLIVFPTILVYSTSILLCSL